MRERSLLFSGSLRARDSTARSRGAGKYTHKYVVHLDVHGAYLHGYTYMYIGFTYVQYMYKNIYVCMRMACIKRTRGKSDEFEGTFRCCRLLESQVLAGLGALRCAAPRSPRLWQHLRRSPEH